MKNLIDYCSVVACLSIFIFTQACQKEELVQRPFVVVNSTNATEGLIGEEILIKGQNFSTSPQENLVSFNYVLGEILEASEQELKVRIPDRATSGPLRVTRKGAENIVEVGPFSILPADGPFIEALLNEGQQPTTNFTVGDLIIIKGKKFDNNAEKNIVTLNGAIVKTEGIINATANEIKLVIPGEATSGPLQVRVFGRSTKPIEITVNTISPLEDGRIYWINNGYIPVPLGSSRPSGRFLVKGKNSNREIPAGEIQYQVTGIFSQSCLPPFEIRDNSELFVTRVVHPLTNRLYLPSRAGSIDFIDLNSTVFEPKRAVVSSDPRVFIANKFWIDPENNYLYYLTRKLNNQGILVNDDTYVVTLKQDGLAVSNNPEIAFRASEGKIIGISKNRIFLQKPDNTVYSVDRNTGLNSKQHPALTVEVFDNLSGIRINRGLITDLKDEDVYFTETRREGNLTTQVLKALINPVSNDNPKELYGTEDKIAEYSYLTPAGKYFYFFRKTSTGGSIARLKKDGSSLRPVDVYSNTSIEYQGAFTLPTMLGCISPNLPVQSAIYIDTND